MMAKTTFDEDGSRDSDSDRKRIRKRRHDDCDDDCGGDDDDYKSGNMTTIRATLKNLSQAKHRKHTKIKNLFSSFERQT